MPTALTALLHGLVFGGTNFLIMGDGQFALILGITYVLGILMGQWMNSTRTK